MDLNFPKSVKSAKMERNVSLKRKRHATPMVPETAENNIKNLQDDAAAAPVKRVSKNRKGTSVNTCRSATCYSDCIEEAILQATKELEQTECVLTPEKGEKVLGKNPVPFDNVHIIDDLTNDVYEVALSKRSLFVVGRRKRVQVHSGDSQTENILKLQETSKTFIKDISDDQSGVDCSMKIVKSSSHSVSLGELLKKVTEAYHSPYPSRLTFFTNVTRRKSHFESLEVHCNELSHGNQPKTVSGMLKLFPEPSSACKKKTYETIENNFEQIQEDAAAAPVKRVSTEKQSTTFTPCVQTAQMDDAAAAPMKTVSQNTQSTSVPPCRSASCFSDCIEKVIFQAMEELEHRECILAPVERVSTEQKSTTFSPCVQTAQMDDAAATPEETVSKNTQSTFVPPCRSAFCFSGCIEKVIFQAMDELEQTECILAPVERVSIEKQSTTFTPCVQTAQMDDAAAAPVERVSRKRKSTSFTPCLQTAQMDDAAAAPVKRVSRKRKSTSFTPCLQTAQMDNAAAAPVETVSKNTQSTSVSPCRGATCFSDCIEKVIFQAMDELEQTECILAPVRRVSTEKKSTTFTPCVQTAQMDDAAAAPVKRVSRKRKSTSFTPCLQTAQMDDPAAAPEETVSKNTQSTSVSPCRSDSCFSDCIEKVIFQAMDEWEQTECILAPVERVSIEKQSTTFSPCAQTAQMDDAAAAPVKRVSIEKQSTTFTPCVQTAQMDDAAAAPEETVSKNTQSTSVTPCRSASCFLYCIEEVIFQAIEELEQRECILAPVERVSIEKQSTTFTPCLQTAQMDDAAAAPEETVSKNTQSTSVNTCTSATCFSDCIEEAIPQATEELEQTECVLTPEKGEKVLGKNPVPFDNVHIIDVLTNDVYEVALSKRSLFVVDRRKKVEVHSGNSPTENLLKIQEASIKYMKDISDDQSGVDCSMKIVKSSAHSVSLEELLEKVTEAYHSPYPSRLAFFTNVSTGKSHFESLEVHGNEHSNANQLMTGTGMLKSCPEPSSSC